MLIEKPVGKRPADEAELAKRIAVEIIKELRHHGLAVGLNLGFGIMLWFAIGGGILFCGLSVLGLGLF